MYESYIEVKFIWNSLPQILIGFMLKHNMVSREKNCWPFFINQENVSLFWKKIPNCLSFYRESQCVQFPRTLWIPIETKEDKINFSNVSLPALLIVYRKIQFIPDIYPNIRGGEMPLSISIPLVIILAVSEALYPGVLAMNIMSGAGS